MNKQTNTAGLFTRRALLIGVAQTALLGVLGGRLAWLQVAQGEKYRSLADDNRINLKILAPSRGRILTRTKDVVARNVPNFRLVMIPEQTDDLKAALQNLKTVIEISDAQIERVLKQASRQPGFVPVEVKDQLAWEDMARVEVALPDLPGLSISEDEIRDYPDADKFAHITGYVGAVSQSDLQTGNPMFSLPGVKVGKTGIEKAFEEELRGRIGRAEMEINALGREVRELNRRQSVPGEDIHLTIDRDLQLDIMNRVGQEKSASAVIMDIHDGAIYAMASYPSFDPNKFTRGLSAEEWEALLADPGLPLNSKAVGGQYPPGSTFKMVTALAALEERLVTARTTYHCPGHYDYGQDRFHCWKRGGHGSMNIEEALAESCDTYFYNIATELGIDKIAYYARRFGLGDKLGIELPEERPGLVPTEAWKMGELGQRWQPGESIVASIGQGYLQSTPLQLATMTAQLVNGGYRVRPWISSRAANRRVSRTKTSLGFTPVFLETVKRGMERAVLHPTGTAYGSHIDIPGLHMGGKTGTSQVRRISREERLEGMDDRNVPWRLRHHALFVGYAPVEQPRYACCVVVDHGGSGSKSAAPIARDIMIAAQRHDPASKPLQDGFEGVSTRNPVVPAPKPFNDGEG